MDLLAALRTFVRLAETGSFSAVARDAGITQPAVSRQVAALEAHLGARLVQRTTRNAALTEEGRDLLAPARDLLEAADRAETAVGRRHGTIDGLVRVGAPVLFSRMLIAPRIQVLLNRHPGLSVDLVRDDGTSDLVRDGVDVAIRVGELAADATYVARRVGTFKRLVVGAAGYLDHTAPPRVPADLAEHLCIGTNRDDSRDTWTLQGPQGPVDVPVTGRFRTDSVEAAREAMLTGSGLAILATWLVRRELADGTVRAVLPDWPPAPVPLHFIYPTRRHLAPRVRAVIGFLQEEIRANPEFAEIRDP